MTDQPERKSKGIDAPKCKICGHRHWFAEPHQFGKFGGVSGGRNGGKTAALEAAKAVVANPPKVKARGKAKKAKRRPKAAA